MNKMEDEVYNLIEEKIFNNCQWSNERTLSKKATDNFDVDALNLFTTKMDDKIQRLNCLNVNTANACGPTPTCDSCGSCDHESWHCQGGNPFPKSTSYIC